MLSRVRRVFLNPIFLVGIAAFLAALVVQSGELGTSDTTHRLATTHSLWTSEAPVDPAEYPEFGIHGRGGKLYSWYGIGQSLLMLPADIAGTYIAALPAFRDYGADPAVRSIVVSYSTNILVCVLTVLACLRLLRLFGFSVSERIAGALALLFCTTFLEYTQNMEENNYILLLTMAGLAFQYEWLRTGSRRALLIGSLALGANLLTRLTTGMDLLAVGIFLVLAWGRPLLRGESASARQALLRGEYASARQALLRCESASEGRRRLAEYAKTAVPIYAIFFLIDRAYQYYRFGSFFNTYMQVYAREQRMLNPALPAAFPFETPFRVGFFGALFTPEKSIFLFDPLLVLTAILALVLWRRFRPEIKAYLIACVALLFGYVIFYAKYTDWSGDFAWGDRYVVTAAQMVAFISVPLLMRHRAEVGRWVWRLGMALVAVSAAVQVASVMFWCPLEIYQMDTLGHPTFVVALRFKNIAAFALGKMAEWGLVNDSMKYDAWDYAHITTWNFLPFLLARVGEAAGWVVRLVTVMWFAALAALVGVLAWVRRVTLIRGAQVEQ
ncbi:MAG: hypothetical protein ACLQMT_09555 [Candidatus Acidiferrales bacterium]